MIIISNEWYPIRGVDLNEELKESVLLCVLKGKRSKESVLSSKDKGKRLKRQPSTKWTDGPSKGSGKPLDASGVRPA